MNRDVVLVIYAAVLGWCLRGWWQRERESLRHDAEYAARAEVLGMQEELRSAAAAGSTS